MQRREPADRPCGADHGDGFVSEVPAVRGRDRPQALQAGDRGQAVARGEVQIVALQVHPAAADDRRECAQAGDVDPQVTRHIDVCGHHRSLLLLAQPHHLQRRERRRHQPAFDVSAQVRSHRRQVVDGSRVVHPLEPGLHPGAPR